MLKRRPKLTIIENPLPPTLNDHIYISRTTHEITGVPLIVLGIATNDSGPLTTFSLDVPNAEQLAQTILTFAAEHRTENPGTFSPSRNAN